MKHRIALAFFLFGLLALFGCRTDPVATPKESASTAKPDTPAADRIEIHGTIVYKMLEGGFFVIEGSDGTVYDPVNLPEPFKQDGRRVKVSARLPKDVMNVRMHGTMIEILTIEAR